MSYNQAKKIFDDLKRFESEIPKVVSEMGSIGQNHFVKSFKDQGFTDNSLEKWQPRKTEDGHTHVNTIGELRRLERKRLRGPRAILVKSGRLRRSIRRVGRGKYAVSLLSDVPYARIHNEGLTGKAWGKRYFKMPKRQFMGSSRNMNNKIEKMIDRHVRRVFK